MSQVSYFSTGLEWSDVMKASVEHKIALPLEHHLKTGDFQLSVHVTIESKRLHAHKPAYEMTLMLKTEEGRKTDIVRGYGEEFFAAVNDASRKMRVRLRKQSPLKRIFENPFKNLPPENWI